MKMKKRPLTLLEIMIVIFLITLITGVIGYNMRGTLDRGRAFRTERAKDQLYDLLMICLADHPGEADQIIKEPVRYLKTMGVAKKPEDLIKDGWGNPFVITLKGDKSDFSIKSESYEKYNKKREKTPSVESNDDEE
jgi:hypothetical protein